MPNPATKRGRAEPMPPVPKSITVGNITAPLFMPFCYASLANLWVHYAIDAKLAAQYFKSRAQLQGFAPMLFGGKAILVVNFQRYTANGGPMLETVNEVELNLLAYPSARVLDVPFGMKLADYLAGQDETKTIGNLRLHVPADNPFAVAAGIALFGEPKFLASFSYAVPSPNDPPQKTWEVTCFDCNPPPDPKNRQAVEDHTIFTLDLDLQGLSSTAVNATPFVEYGVLGGRPIGSNWNMFGMVQTWHPFEGAGRRCRITTGASKHSMRTDMARLLGRKPAPVAVQLFETPPVSTEPRAYYVDLP